MLKVKRAVISYDRSFYDKKYNLDKKQATLQVVFVEYRVLFNKDSSILKIEMLPKVIFLHILTF